MADSKGTAGAGAGAVPLPALDANSELALFVPEVAGQTALTKGNTYAPAPTNPAHSDADLYAHYKSAAAQSPIAANNLGVFTLLGRGTARDEKAAYASFQQSAAAGSKVAANNAAVCDALGLGTAALAPAQALAAFADLSASTPAALVNAGRLYESGRAGGAADEAKALALYEQAAAKGYAFAQNLVGLAYDGGIGCSEDEAKAFKSIEAAANAGFAAAQHNLGCCYEDGRGVAQDSAKAVHFWSLAAAQGHGAAANECGLSWDKGRGTGYADEKRAFEYYQMGAAAQNGPAMYNMAQLLEYGIEGVAEADERKAWLLFEAAAAKGHAQSQAVVADRLLSGKGQGVPPAAAVRDPKKAREYYEASAAAECAAGISGLAICYLKGSGGLKVDEQKAIALMEKAAGMGHALSQWRLGSWHHVGAAKLPRDPKKAFALYEASAKQGFAESQYYLGCAYLDGIGVATNAPRAWELFRLAAEQGHPMAEAKIAKKPVPRASMAITSLFAADGANGAVVGRAAAQPSFAGAAAPAAASGNGYGLGGGTSSAPTSPRSGPAELTALQSPTNARSPTGSTPLMDFKQR